MDGTFRTQALQVKRSEVLKWKCEKEKQDEPCCLQAGGSLLHNPVLRHDKVGDPTRLNPVKHSYLTVEPHVLVLAPTIRPFWIWGTFVHVISERN